MIKKLFFFTLLFLSVNYVKASGLPIDTLNSNDVTKPLVIYISGDGGFNDFSKQFMQQWNKNGYPVVALNAKSYFWKTKTPEDASKDVATLITQYLFQWKRTQVLLVGYSLGADVIPFILTRLPANIAGKIKHAVLFSPSKTTDFTVHLFYSDKDGSSVSAEINKLTQPVMIIFGEKETNLPDKEISNKQASIFKVPGEHHYNNDVDAVINSVIKKL